MRKGFVSNKVIASHDERNARLLRVTAPETATSSATIGFPQGSQWYIPHDRLKHKFRILSDDWEANLGIVILLRKKAIHVQLHPDWFNHLATAFESVFGPNFSYLTTNKATVSPSMIAIRTSLPCYAKRTEIISTIQNNSVVVISGSTGCGKTTQIPQFILEDYISNGIGGKCNIICTQPRRISAIGVSNRVAEERNEPIGKVIGYQIRLEKKISKTHTRLIFCTTGILLRKLTGNPTLHGITHVILDEVHEREILCDFLLILLKNLLQTTRPDLKVILMSATVNSELFSKYFNDAPCLNIPGRTFPVQQVLLGDVMKEIGQTSLSAMQQKFPEQIDYETIVKLVNKICSSSNKEHKGHKGHKGNGQDKEGNGILIFMPGLYEITHLCNLLNSNNKNNNRLIVPLHGSLSSKDQKKVFQKAPVGTRKIVVSTNVAETSVTIEDVVYVIDTGRGKLYQKKKEKKEEKREFIIQSKSSVTITSSSSFYTKQQTLQTFALDHISETAKYTRNETLFNLSVKFRDELSC